jgi:tetratricopeptide (TPR) repeat protein
VRNIEIPPARQLDVQLRSAEILSEAGTYAEAATDFEAASRLAPDRADIFYNLALARYRVGQWDAALESANKAKAIEDSGSLEFAR